MRKDCMSLLRSKSNVSYCVNYHEWIDTCPSRCNYYQKEKCGSLENVVKHQYNFECLYFTRIKEDPLKEPVFYCKLMFLPNPHCDACRFTSYSPESLLTQIQYTFQ